ncbi:toll/interleukin-1 receptor domain-containing protein [Sedimentitalea sp. JM2-8]|uniref:Toll/interleukin-1 receptor domain-containing protein n=1 Tax=Sedimentitalea xiamensis TaxID=3050037 RepID=A0ABT7FK71_9RHOB|nr:toll/interleukin-1 receptor domain-containing protein [Sedimentitalea xiamensis]MDK3075542.1 toll/interleukin-1 receptor domain-containing protein [Sedimentitalea xiamensis]
MRAFISYSHHDNAALERLHDHLKNLIQDGHIETFYDRDILAGSELDADIERKMEAADLFLLAASPDFIASDCCVEREMKRVPERHAAGNARVLPIVVKECDWKVMDMLRQLKAGDNSANGGFNVSADDYEHFLTQTMNMFGNAGIAYD